MLANKEVERPGNIVVSGEEIKLHITVDSSVGIFSNRNDNQQPVSLGPNVHIVRRKRTNNEQLSYFYGSLQDCAVYCYRL